MATNWTNTAGKNTLHPGEFAKKMRAAPPRSESQWIAPEPLWIMASAKTSDVIYTIGGSYTTEYRLIELDAESKTEKRSLPLPTKIIPFPIGLILSKNEKTLFVVTYDPAAFTKPSDVISIILSEPEMSIGESIQVRDATTADGAISSPDGTRIYGIRMNAPGISIISTNPLNFVLNGVDARIFQATAHKDGKIIHAISEDIQTALWHIRSINAESLEILGEEQSYVSGDFIEDTRDGSFYATSNSVIRKMDPMTLSVIRSANLNLGSKASIYTRVTPSGEYMMIAERYSDPDDSILFALLHVLDLRTYEIISTQPTQYIMAIDFNPSGEIAYLHFAGYDLGGYISGIHFLKLSSLIP